MHVSRLGLTPLKGARHTAVDELPLAGHGPIGDRVFCLVDVAQRQVLRTVEHPSLIEVRAAWDGHVLGLRLPDGLTVEARPGDAGTDLVADYWGREAVLRLQTGPHAAALSDYLGRAVRLARATPGEVVYAGSVSLVTTSALDELASRTGRAWLAAQDARFRATVTLHTDADADVDLDTVPTGTRLSLGAATVEVGGPIPRCAVIDLDPVTGKQTVPVLRTLAGYRRGAGEIHFGVDARVVVPGRVRRGDPALVEA